MQQFNEFTNSSSQLTANEFQELERLVGGEIPSSVKEHYLGFNGGEPEKYLFRKDGDTYVVQEFFSVKYGAVGHRIEDNYNQLVTLDKVIPKNLVPFACDPAGDFYCFDIETGQISIFRSEFLPNYDKCIKPIAESMTDFVNGLEGED